MEEAKKTVKTRTGTISVRLKRQTKRKMNAFSQLKSNLQSACKWVYCEYYCIDQLLEFSKSLIIITGHKSHRKLWVTKQCLCELFWHLSLSLTVSLPAPASLSSSWLIRNPSLSHRRCQPERQRGFMGDSEQDTLWQSISLTGPDTH